MRITKKKLMAWLDNYPGTLMCVVNHEVVPSIVTWFNCNDKALPAVARAEWFSAKNWNKCEILLNSDELNMGE